MEIRFDGKRALVTGADKGIGGDLALKLADAGAEVVAVSRTQSDLDSLKQENPKIQTVFADVVNWDAIQIALRDVGPIDLLVNNAGIMPVNEFESISKNVVYNVVSINVKTVVNVSEIIVSKMKASGKGGAIVNLSSCMGIGAANFCSVYCASKASVDKLTKSMAVELGPYKIRVNAVNPTVVRTKISEEIGMFDTDNVVVSQLQDRTPLKRFAEISDVVGPILFLLSDHAAMISGAVVPIDGGLGDNYDV